MAFETPRHAMRFGVIDDAHVIHVAVAAEATDAAIDVGRVIVKNVIRRAMNLHPLDRFASLPTLPDRLQLRIVLLHLRMAVHAGLGVR